MLARLQLTAAHCGFINAIKVKTRVSISATTFDDPRERHEVAQFIPHENYLSPIEKNGDLIDVQNDIAVFSLKTESNEPLTSWSTDRSIPRTGDLARIVGFGSIDGNWIFNGGDRLRETTLTVQDNAECIRAYNPGLFKADQMACASNPNSTPCVGDSGSPFFDTTSNNIVGILSFSVQKCPIGGKPVMTRVSNYDQWIKEKICLISKFPPGDCTIAATCGDKMCTPNKETTTSCPQDCLPESLPLTSGDAFNIGAILSAIVSTIGVFLSYILFCIP